MRYMAASLVTILLTGCFGLFDSSSDTITGRYNVEWVDIVSSRSIHMSDKEGEAGGPEIVPAYVYAVGHNSRFIVAKQHPSEKENESITAYYIVDLSKENYYWQKGVYGPLNEAKYDSLCKELGVGAIDFNMKYPEKPWTH